MMMMMFWILSMPLALCRRSATPGRPMPVGDEPKLPPQAEGTTAAASANAIRAGRRIRMERFLMNGRPVDLLLGVDRSWVQRLVKKVIQSLVRGDDGKLARLLTEVEGVGRGCRPCVALRQRRQAIPLLNES